MALEGISQFWSRNKNNIGKGTSINKELFETFVNAIQDEKGMVAPKLIYFTNSEETNFTRSHNWELHRELYYKVGYTYHSDWKSYDNNKIVRITKGWVYKFEKDETLEFKETSAHEIGHQLLFDFGKGGYDGRDYSYGHKGTSGPTWIQQDPLPGTKYPPSPEEIDLMKYAEGYRPEDYFERVVLSEKDSLGLVWLSKLKIITILCAVLFIGSCQKNPIKEVNREIVDYYNGVIMDENHKPIEGVKVTMYPISSDNNEIDKEKVVLVTSTDKKGYFAIRDTNIDSLHLMRVQTEYRKLFFEKKGYISDSVSTNIGRSDYRPKYDDFDGLHFIFKIPDTLTLQKDTL